MKKGISLSGGGVKGAAHVGALKALEEENISFDYISGTSSGSIVAALYASGYTPDEIYKLFKKYAKKISYVDWLNILKGVYGLIFKRKIIINGLKNGKIIEKIINQACNKKNIYNINEINIPLIIPAIDLHDGSIIIFNSMKNRIEFSNQTDYINDINIGKAVRASCSYPGIFSPCEYKNTELVDGGIRENVPWKETKKAGADKVLSIVFEKELKDDCCNNIIDVIMNSLDILSYELSNYELEGADYLLKIKTKEQISLLDMNKIDYLYNEGYIQTKKKIKDIKELFEVKEKID